LFHIFGWLIVSKPDKKSLHRVNRGLSETGIKAEMAFFSRKKPRPSHDIVTQ